MKILGKNENLGQKWQFWARMKILGQNENFGQEWKFWTKMKILGKNENLGQKWQFWAKMKILVKNDNFGQERKFWAKMEILVKNEKFWKQKWKLSKNWNCFWKYLNFWGHLSMIHFVRIVASVGYFLAYKILGRGLFLGLFLDFHVDYFLGLRKYNYNDAVFRTLLYIILLQCIPSNRKLLFRKFPIRRNPKI